MKKPPIHILCFENTAYTLRTLKSVRATSPGHPVFLHDNGSTPENREIVAAALRDGERLVLNQVDPSWDRRMKIGRAKNLQLEMSGDADPEWVLMLDNDVLVKDGLWEKMKRYVAAFPDVAMWGLEMAPSHRVIKTETRGELVIRITTLFAGYAALINRRTALSEGVRWPEEQVDYSDHPHVDAMGPEGLGGGDFKFADDFRAAGYRVALPEHALVEHVAQPGKTEGYR